MALARIAGDRIVLESEWRERELCKMVPGCKWDERSRLWWAPLSWASCVALRGVFEEHLEIGPDLNAWAAEQVAERVAPCLELRQATTTDRDVYDGVDGLALEPMQAVAVDFLATARRALLGDGMGSGKTIEAICAVEELASREGDDAVFPCLVVPNNSMVYGWAEELAKWAPHRSTVVLKAGAAGRRKLIERMTPCPVHGVPRSLHTPRTCADRVTGVNTTENQQAIQGTSRISDAGSSIGITVETDAGIAGRTTSGESTTLRLRITPGCYIVKDSSVVSAVKQNLSEVGKELSPSLSIIATRPDGCVVFYVGDVTSLSSEKMHFQDGSNEQTCTCESRVEFGVMNWESLAAHTRLAGYGSIALSDKEKEPKELNEAGIRTVLADEAHRAKNPKAKQTRAWWWVSWAADNSIAMSGTPTDKTPESLWSIMHGVAPDEWPSKSPWVDRYCVPPEAPVWLADGTFSAIGDVKQGDLVMGFSKEPIVGRGNHPRLEPSTVLKTHRHEAALVRVTTSEGREFLCTPDHKWLSGWECQRDKGPRVMWFTEPATEMKLVPVVTPPPALPVELERVAAWLGGIYDGEASGMMIAQSRRANPDVWEAIGDALRRLGFEYTLVEDVGYKLTGGRSAYAKFLHWCRPVKRRSISPGERYSALGKNFYGALRMVGPQEWITKVEPAGSGEVVSLTTSTETYVVHGYASHNCTKSWGYFGGLEVNGLRGDTREELYKYLDPRFIRRPTQVVCPDIAEKLPPQIRYVDLPPKQRKAYDAMKKEMLAELEEGVLLAGDPITKLLRLHQLASAYGEVTEETVDEHGKLRQTYRMEDPSAKADALMDLVEELDEDPAVIFARHRQLVDVCAARLERAGVPYGLLTGAVTPLDRAQNVQRFQAGQLPIMLCTLGAGAESVTLTRARHVGFLQRGSLLQNKQAEDRVWRRGQDRPVQPIIWVARNTVEEAVIERGGDAEEAFQAVVRDEDTLRRMLA